MSGPLIPPILLIWRCLGTIYPISKRMVLCHQWKPDSNRRHVQRHSLRGWKFYECKTRHYSFIISRWCWSPHSESFSARESLCYHATSASPTAVNTHSTTEVCPTTRNHIWKRLVKEFIPALLPQKLLIGTKSRSLGTKKTLSIKIEEVVRIFWDMTPQKL